MWLDLNADKAHTGQSASNTPLSPIFRGNTGEAPKQCTSIENKVEEMLRQFSVRFLLSAPEMLFTDVLMFESFVCVLHL